MDDELYALNREQRENFLAMQREYLARQPRTRGVDLPLSEHFTPEVYVARTPSGGIPGVELHGTGTSGTGTADDEPNGALCNCYVVESAEGTGTGTSSDHHIRPVPYVSHWVWNLSNAAVPGNTWILIVRDKVGSWIVAEVGGDGDSVGKVDWIRVTSNTTSGGYYPGIIRVLSGASWSDGDDCKVVIAEGACFIPGKIYKGKYEGRINGVKKYSCGGNDKYRVEYEAENGTGDCVRKWDMTFPLAPFTVNEDIGSAWDDPGTNP